MDWLKDKKNQPIVALIAAVVIVAVGVVMYFMVFKSDDSSGDSADMATMPDASMGTSAPTPDPNAAPGQPAPPADPNAAVGQPAPTADPNAAGGAQAAAPAANAVQTASAGPTEAWRSDPFLPFNYKKPVRAAVRTIPRIYDLPIPPPIFSYPTIKGKPIVPLYEAPQPARRMAGLMLNGKVYAIIETNGASEIVQPGQMLKDGLATVEKIERDKVVLKTTDDKPRYLVVSMAANRQSSLSAGGGDYGGPMPGGPGPGPMPGGPMPRPGGPPGMPAP